MKNNTFACICIIALFIILAGCTASSGSTAPQDSQATSSTPTVPAPQPVPGSSGTSDSQPDSSTSGSTSGSSGQAEPFDGVASRSIGLSDLKPRNARSPRGMMSVLRDQITQPIYRFTADEQEYIRFARSFAGSTLEDEDDYEDYIDDIDDLLEDYPDTPLRPQLEFLHAYGRVLLAQGSDRMVQYELALKEMSALLARYPAANGDTLIDDTIVLFAEQYLADLWSEISFSEEIPLRLAVLSVQRQLAEGPLRNSGLAQAKCTEIVSSYPQLEEVSSDCLLSLGTSALDDGDVDAALDSFERILDDYASQGYYRNKVLCTYTTLLQENERGSRELTSQQQALVEDALWAFTTSDDYFAEMQFCSFSQEGRASVPPIKWSKTDYSVYVFDMNPLNERIIEEALREFNVLTRSRISFTETESLSRSDITFSLVGQTTNADEVDVRFTLLEPSDPYTGTSRITKASAIVKYTDDREEFKRRVFYALAETLGLHSQGDHVSVLNGASTLRDADIATLYKLYGVGETSTS